jgi:hypothetical protein
MKPYRAVILAAAAVALVLGSAIHHRARAQSSIFPGNIQVATATGTTSLGSNLTLAAPLNSQSVLLVCGLTVTYTGGGTITPISLGGLPGGTVYFQGTSLGQPPLQQSFQPCLPVTAGSAATLGVTTDNNATKVSAILWGLWQ